MMGNLSGGAPEGVPLLFLTDEYFSKFPLFLEKTLSLEYEGILHFCHSIVKLWENWRILMKVN